MGNTEMVQKKFQRILIVDDAPENIEALAALLKESYMIVAARTGEQGIHMAQKTRPDLILLDIVMPGMNGYDVCRQLKQADLTKDIPVIFITALSEAIEEANAFKIGAVDYITKPFQPLVVKARVQTHLNLKMKTDMLEALASLDGLTNIHNRRKFDENIAHEWKRAIRNQSPLSLIMMDIDYFKHYNDHYGHASGDECLKKVAAGLKETLQRPNDFLARYGGEEFVAILPDTDLKGAEYIGNKIHGMMDDLNIPHAASEAADHVTMSLGICTVLLGHVNPSPIQLVEAADQLLYQSKVAGRNRFTSRLIYL